MLSKVCPQGREKKEQCGLPCELSETSKPGKPAASPSCASEVGSREKVVIIMGLSNRSASGSANKQ